MFEDYTFESIMKDVLKNAPDGVDTRQGSIYYDAVSGLVLKIAKLYADLDIVFQLTQLTTTTGDYLDIKASEYGLTRQAATAVQYYVEFTGAYPETGERFFYDGIYFTLYRDEDGDYYLLCDSAGAEYNIIASNSAVVPVNNIDGLKTAIITGFREYGTDAETDEALRTRVQVKLSGPAENGNKLHYKTWCESVEGVGIARITPLWNGPNTVKAVLINGVGKPCGESVVDAVQEYVDPATKGYSTVVDGVEYVVGDGLGEGVANLGAHFTAAPAKEVGIVVTADIELATGYDISNAEEEAKNAVNDYLEDLVLTTSDAADIIVRVSAIGAAIAGLGSVLDYNNLRVNGGTKNVIPGEDGVPVLEGVTLNVL
jgi:uncharacterized phage protein gp47/JayE